MGSLVADMEELVQIHPMMHPTCLSNLSDAWVIRKA